MSFIAKLVAWYVNMVDYFQYQSPGERTRGAAHFLAVMLLTSPLTVGLIIQHEINMSKHPEIHLREASVRAISGNPRLAPMMQAWLACFDNTLMNYSWGPCDLAVDDMVRQQHLEGDFAKFKKWRESIYESLTSRFGRNFPAPPPWDH